MENKKIHFEDIEFHIEDFKRHIPSLVISSEDTILGAKKYLAECFEKIKQLMEESYHPKHIMGVRTRMIDYLVISLYHHFEKQINQETAYKGDQIAVVAQGGFGRGEMNLYSDVDLLFIIPNKSNPVFKKIVDKILYLLWDLKLDVGYASRTLSECRLMLLEDATIMTSLLDARYLCGNEILVEKLRLQIKKTLSKKIIRKKLIKLKTEESKKRIENFGGSVFVLEPNIKECAGGLRDLQTVLWISKILGIGDDFSDLLAYDFLNQDEYNQIISARNFLWQLRNEIHLLTHRKTDQLTFDRQSALASQMGFTDSGDILAVEHFMQHYYKVAYQVFNLTDKIIRRLKGGESRLNQLLLYLKTKNIDEHFKLIDGRLAVKSRDLFIKKPPLMLKAFEHVQKLGIEIHPATKDHIRSLIHTIDDEFRTNIEMVLAFRQMLNNYKNLGKVLFQMHDTHFLDEWMPEFKKLRCRVQHDAYHIYTIDTHSIFAVNELSKLAFGEYNGKFDDFSQVLEKIKNPELLTLGLFLHDIGKGEGGNHHIKGAKIAESITQRLEYSAKEKEAIDFLITSHLMMPHLSQRRDLDDPDLIQKFASSMGDTDKLNMLYLLTWADIRAVGPDAWTDWKGSLLTKLYQKTKEVMQKGEHSKEKTKARVKRVAAKLLEALVDRYSKEDLEAYLKTLPPRYFFSVDKPYDFERHFLMNKKAENDQVVVEIYDAPNQNMNEILINTINSPYVFQQITGVLLAYAINIIRVDIYPMSHGHVLIVLLVTDSQGKPMADLALFDIIKTNLKGVFTGQIKVENLLQRQKVPDYMIKKPIQKAKTKVEVDNVVSSYYTVIDIYAHDRLGLLYDITKTLGEQSLYVEVSKISTKVEQVSDVFYVKDIFGHKIIDTSKIKKIKEALSKVVEG